MTLQAALTILFFTTSFLAIFTPLLVYVRKSEEKRYLKARVTQRLEYKRAESESAWILNRRLWTNRD